MANISLNSVSKSYGPGNVAVESLDLEIADGELMVLVGPSGCGKSTTLRMLAGLEELTAGTILVGGQTVNNLPPQRRDVAMVFQNYALYPHMSVAENLGFGLRMRKVSKDEIRRRVTDVAEILGLTDYLDRKPVALSGGQRQRVAMGRAMVREPRAFLMDEPLSNLDAKLRVDMRAELAQLHERLRVTTVYVTHDQTEAMTLGDRIAVLDKGRLQQAGPPQELYESPANMFVAGFLGSPAMNMVTAEVTSDGGPALRIGASVVRLPQRLADQRDLSRRSGSQVVVGIRPPDLFVASGDTDNVPVLPGHIEVVESLGSEVDLLFALDETSVAAPGRQSASSAARRGIENTLWTAVVNPASVRAVRHGAHLEFGFDPDNLHFFDPETGAALGSRHAAHAA